MFVIMDIEWYENRFSGHIQPTQLAAVRTDGHWQPTQSFSAPIHTLHGKAYEANFIGFNGYSRESFIDAAAPSAVFESLKSWLQDDDVLLWWSSESPDKLDVFTNEACGFVLPNKKYVIDRYVCRLANKHSNPYKVLAHLGKSPPKPEHYSLNDAFTVCEVLRTLEVSQDTINDQNIDMRPRGNGEVNSERFNYIIDSKSFIVHKIGCELYDRHHSLKYLIAIKKCVFRHGISACECCKKDFDDALIERNNHLIEKDGFSYIYNDTSSFYHLSSCPIPLTEGQIIGCYSARAAQEHGKLPCPACKPSTANDERKAATLGFTNEAVKIAIKKQHSAKAAVQAAYDNINLSAQEKADIRTLEQPATAFVAARGNKTFHTKACRNLNGLHYLIGFSKYSDATFSGYVPCRTCRPTPKDNVSISIPLWSEERPDETLDDLKLDLEQREISYTVDGSDLCIETKIGSWKIHTDTMPVTLSHFNKTVTYRESQWHTQPRIFLSMSDAVRYIMQHDSLLAKRSFVDKFLQPPEKCEMSDISEAESGEAEL